MKLTLTPEEQEARKSRHAETRSTTITLMFLLVAASVALLIVGFMDTASAITQTALFAASAVCGILARIAQSSVQHFRVMEELRRQK
jgi:hypothetical protein